MTNESDNNHLASTTFTPIQEVLPIVADQIDQLFLKKDQLRAASTSTGFESLDAKMSGLHAGDLVVVAGRPSIGKTSLALNIAQSVALDAKLHVAIFSIDQYATVLTKNMLSSISEIELNKLNSGKLEDEDWEELAIAIAALNDASISINDISDLTPNDIYHDIRQQHRIHDQLGVIVIDYLQLIKFPRNRNDRKGVGQISLMFQTLKKLAIELAVPIVIVSELSDSVELRDDQRPGYSNFDDLRSVIEQHADTVLFVYNGILNNFSDTEILVHTKENRTRLVGSIYLDFDSRYLKFDDTVYTKIKLDHIDDLEEVLNNDVLGKEQYIKLALSTKPVNLNVIQPTLSSIYHALGLAEPEVVYTISGHQLILDHENGSGYQVHEIKDINSKSLDKWNKYFDSLNALFFENSELNSNPELEEFDKWLDCFGHFNDVIIEDKMKARFLGNGLFISKAQYLHYVVYFSYLKRHGFLNTKQRNALRLLAYLEVVFEQCSWLYLTNQRLFIGENPIEFKCNTKNQVAEVHYRDGSKLTASYLGLYQKTSSLPIHWVNDPTSIDLNEYYELADAGWYQEWGQDKSICNMEVMVVCADQVGWHKLLPNFDNTSLRAFRELSGGDWDYLINAGPVDIFTYWIKPTSFQIVQSKVDENNILHCTDGPALIWEDGWEAYCWHGTVIPKDWVLAPDSIKVEELMKASFEEHIAGADLLGWDKLPCDSELLSARISRERHFPHSDHIQMCHKDHAGNFHCNDGPSIVWDDGWEAYCLHGIQVPKHWIVNKSELTAAEVLAAENVDLRAAGAEIVGWGKIEAELGAKIIDDSGSEDIGQLIELTLPGLDDPERFLKAWCPRNGWIYEAVPAFSDVDDLPIKTALHAQAWRVGETKADYVHPITRT